MTKYDWSNVPKNVNWIATSHHNRNKTGYPIKPLKDESMLCWCTRWCDGDVVLLGVSEFKGDWRESLEGRPGGQ